MTDSWRIVFVLLFPLASFLQLGLFGKTFTRLNRAGQSGTLSILLAFLLSAWIAYQYFFDFGRVDGVYQKLELLKFNWLQFSPGVSIDMGFMVDPISMMMIVIITFVSLMVHIFSLGYMKGEERFGTYYAYLSLFTFSMLGLVLSCNIFQTYIFWELVGVSSYLLIGFYFDRPSAVAAAKKAFIVTRFADLGFLIGILILAFHAQTLDFGILIERLTHSTSQLNSITSVSFLGASALTWALLLVFMGGAGKSAMFPLHIWLPDAMEGPTPVSALIHAATMVVAGVYLVARLFPVFAISCPGALQVIAYVGAISALLAAIIACTQTDIKRVLAYSTISQIGFMMFSLGVARYGGENSLGFTASMFHLFTHAMFKALLFLGAGAVIHYVHSNEMKDMGGLRKLMPITHITFLTACLAIAGVPPFSGFFSKEEILSAAYAGDKIVYGIALFTAGLTAFYMFRLYFSIFWNKQYSSGNQHSHDVHAHDEGAWSMKFPLLILGVLAAVVGLVPFGNYVSADGRALPSEFNFLSAMPPVLIGLTGIMLAWIMYKRQNDLPQRVSSTLKVLYSWAYHKFYFDEVYLFVTQKIIFNIFGKSSAWADKNIVDGAMNLSADLTADTSGLIRNWQSGKLQQYAFWFFAGVVAVVAVFMFVGR